MFRHKDLFGPSFRFGLSFRCLDRFFGLVSITISSIRLALGVELLGIPAIHVVDLFETLIVCFRKFIKARDFVFSVGSKIWKRIKKSICSQLIHSPHHISVLIFISTPVAALHLGRLRQILVTSSMVFSFLGLK